MRDQGFEFKDPDEVDLDDWIVTEFDRIGPVTRRPKVARKIGSVGRVAIDLGWRYDFYLDGVFDPFTVAGTAQVPVTRGPC